MMRSNSVLGFTRASADGYDGPVNVGDPTTPLFSALHAAGLNWGDSDVAVRRIRQRHGWLAPQRVPFDEWATEVGLTCDPTLTETPNES